MSGRSLWYGNKKAPTLTHYKRIAKGKKGRTYKYSNVRKSLVPFQQGRQLSYIIPNMLKTKLKYGDVFPLDTTGGATYVNKLFKLNTIYDPEEAIGGGEPTGHDELATLYSKYHIYAAKMKVHVINTTAYPVFCNLMWGDADNVWPGSGTDVQQYALEMPNVKTLSLLPYTYGDHCSGWLTKFIKVSDIWKGQDTNGTDFTALTGADPSKKAYFSLTLADATGGRTSVTATAIVQITYYCKFYSKKIATSD